MADLQPAARPTAAGARRFRAAAPDDSTCRRSAAVIRLSVFDGHPQDLPAAASWRSRGPGGPPGRRQTAAQAATTRRTHRARAPDRISPSGSDTAASATASKAAAVASGPRPAARDLPPPRKRPAPAAAQPTHARRGRATGAGPPNPGDARISGRWLVSEPVQRAARRRRADRCSPSPASDAPGLGGLAAAKQKRTVTVDQSCVAARTRQRG